MGKEPGGPLLRVTKPQALLVTSRGRGHLTAEGMVSAGKRRKCRLDGALVAPVVTQGNRKKFTSMNSGVACHLASAATGHATRDAKQSPRPVAPVNRGAGPVLTRPARPGRGTAAGPGGAATRGPRARPTWPEQSCSRGSRGADAPRLPACGRASSPAMAATDGVLLQLSAAPGTSSRPRTAQARRPAQATKRKRQASRQAPPAKRRSATSSLPAKKTAAREAPRALKGKAKAKKVFSPKKSSAGARDRTQEQKKPGVKTSSLFKNNPEIPQLRRPLVKQVQENVFSSEAFHELDLHPHLISTINAVLNMSQMTSVQKQSIPVLLEGRDALVRSQTGSGKTLAYCIPVVQSLQAMKTKIQRSDGPYALVLVPTRELALQSFDTFQKLLKPFTWIVPGVLMGGEKRKSEKARLRKGINILISTPGRLVDHIKSTKNVHFSRVQWLVLDEADRILDLGFEKDVTVILNAVNAESQKRQNVLLSATLTEGVTRLADISLHNPVSISVLDESLDPSSLEDHAFLDACAAQPGDELDGFAIPEGLDQYVTLVPSKLRLVCLAAFLLQKCKFEADQKVIVFFSSCELVEFHYHLFLQTLLSSPEAPAPGQMPSGCSRFRFLRLHGSMDQEERTAVFREFSHSGTGVLFCTDVAARGLDLPHVTWIVQYNAPSSPAEYIHRIGRTARIGCHGSSLLVLAPSEAEYVNSLAAHKINVSEMKMEAILSVLTSHDCFRGRRRGGQKSQADGPQEIQERATVLQTVFEDYVHSSEKTVSWAKRALQSFIRAYTTYPQELKHIFHVRALHLGHVAKSFGLRDAPRKLSGPAVKKRKAAVRRPDLRRKTQRKCRLAEMLRSEYSSGAEAAGPDPEREEDGSP